MNDPYVENTSDRKPWLVAAIVGVLAVAAIAAAFVFFSNRDRVKTAPSASKTPAAGESPRPAQQPPVIDYDNLGRDAALQEEMGKRKEKYDLGDGIDLVVREDEAVKVGNRTVTMETIREQFDLQKGRVVEKDLQNSRSINKENVTEYGIHVVQPGENIWDIHFALLKDYFAGKNIDLSPLADEADKNGTSSGVGKILKFSESMVTIYNLEENKIEIDLDNIRPLERIVVYRMDGVFALLGKIDYKDIKNLAFDGRTLWIPAARSALTDS